MYKQETINIIKIIIIIIKTIYNYINYKLCQFEASRSTLLYRNNSYFNYFIYETSDDEVVSHETLLRSSFLLTVMKIVCY